MSTARKWSDSSSSTHPGEAPIISPKSRKSSWNRRKCFDINRRSPQQYWLLHISTPVLTFSRELQLDTCMVSALTLLRSGWEIDFNGASRSGGRYLPDPQSFTFLINTQFNSSCSHQQNDEMHLNYSPRITSSPLFFIVYRSRGCSWTKLFDHRGTNPNE